VTRGWLDAENRAQVTLDLSAATVDLPVVGGAAALGF